jgi:cation diffusion facilitator CzcD-associated flavoprotein CzcO
MSAEQVSQRVTPPTKLDVLVVGAGFSGLYALHRLREMGRAVHVIDAGSDVGGVWYWNRYLAQPEILAYISHVADRFDLRPSITFNTKVESLTWDDTNCTWTATTDKGDTVVAEHVVMATGQLSVAQLPDIPGIKDFNREAARHHPGGTHRRIGEQSALDVDPEALIETFEGLWKQGGPDILASYKDLRTDETTAEKAGAFVRE